METNRDLIYNVFWANEGRKKEALRKQAIIHGLSSHNLSLPLAAASEFLNKDT